MKIILEFDGPVFDPAPVYYAAHQAASGDVGWSRLDQATFWRLLRTKGRQADFLPGAKPVKIAEYQKGKKGIVVPVHDGRRGHPVVLDMKYLEALVTLRGDVGAKSVIDSHADDVREVKIDSDEILIDVDTREAWEKVRSRLS